MALIAEKFVQGSPAQAVYDAGIKPVVDIDLSLCAADERPRMVALINRLAKSPKGKETLEIAKEGGFSFYFYQGSATAFGAASAEKKLRLNSVISDDKLIGTLCHECRHAGQFIRSEGVDKDRFNLHSRMMFDRAMEADAQVYAASACEELKRQGDAGPQEKFADFYPEIHQAFVTALDQNKGVVDDRVATETFKAWFDQKSVKEAYEETCLLKPMAKDAERLDYGNDPLMNFDKEISAKNVIELMSWTKDGSYFKDDPAVLETGKYVDISENTQTKIKEYFSTRQYETGEKPDSSIDRLPIRQASAKQGIALENSSDRLDRILTYKKSHSVQKSVQPSQVLAGILKQRSR